MIFNEIAIHPDIIDEFDKYHYFKLCSFMIQVCRLRSYEELKINKQKAIEQAKSEQSKSGKQKLLVH
jgi:hypothetical protein